ncbi:Endochitinase 1 [Kluyveromyces marxianus]|nr:Endochitinase 1 [Kluyveromyces marxianus]
MDAMMELPFGRREFCPNVAVYWGQASAGSQESLGTYCQSDNVDIVLLSFLYSFPDNLAVNFASACTDTFEDGLLHCSSIAADIKTCQDKGKKVLLSMGGAIGSYGFTDDKQAEDFATTLWNTFGEGSADGVERPFDSAVVDGFDFDIENNNPKGYAALATKLRTLFSKGTKDYYISAAPQCFYPDASVGDALANADIDFAFIQFYNNYCNVDKQFNWDTWTDFAQNTSPNKDIKLYLGLPGSATGAGSGYISDLGLVESTVKKISESPNFGGIMLWDASQEFTNIVDGKPYVEQMKDILNKDAVSNSAAPSSASQATSSASTSSSSASSTTTTSTSTSVSSSTAAPTTTASSSSSSSSSSFSSTLTLTSAITTTLSKSTLSVSTTTSNTKTSETKPETKTLQPTTPSTTSISTPAPTSSSELNQQFSEGKMNGKDTCFDGEISCDSVGKIAICNYGEWVHTECAAGTTCFAYSDDSVVSISCNFSYLKADWTL